MLLNVAGDGNCYFHAVGYALLLQPVEVSQRLLDLVHELDVQHNVSPDTRAMEMFARACEHAQVTLALRPSSIPVETRQRALASLRRVLQSRIDKGSLWELQDALDQMRDGSATLGMVLLLRRCALLGVLRQLANVYEEKEMRQELLSAGECGLEVCQFFAEGCFVNTSAVTELLDLNISVAVYTRYPAALGGAQAAGLPGSRVVARLLLQHAHYQLILDQDMGECSTWSNEQISSFRAWWNALASKPTFSECMKPISDKCPFAVEAADVDVASLLWVPSEEVALWLRVHIRDEEKFRKLWLTTGGLRQRYRAWARRTLPECPCGVSRRGCGMTYVPVAEAAGVLGERVSLFAGAERVPRVYVQLLQLWLEFDARYLEGTDVRKTWRQLFRRCGGACPDVSRAQLMKMVRAWYSVCDDVPWGECLQRGSLWAHPSFGVRARMYMLWSHLASDDGGSSVPSEALNVSLWVSPTCILSLEEARWVAQRCGCWRGDVENFWDSSADGVPMDAWLLLIESRLSGETVAQRMKREPCAKAKRRGSEMGVLHGRCARQRVAKVVREGSVSSAHTWRHIALALNELAAFECWPRWVGIWLRWRVGERHGVPESCWSSMYALVAGTGWTFMEGASASLGGGAASVGGEAAGAAAGEATSEVLPLAIACWAPVVETVCALPCLVNALTGEMVGATYTLDVTTCARCT